MSEIIDMWRVQSSIITILDLLRFEDTLYVRTVIGGTTKMLLIIDKAQWNSNRHCLAAFGESFKYRANIAFIHIQVKHDESNKSLIAIHHVIVLQDCYYFALHRSVFDAGRRTSSAWSGVGRSP